MDLSSTPAESTRLKSRNAKKMVDRKDKGNADNREVFKIPNPPTNNKHKHQRIKSVAERKTDLLSRWGGIAISNGVKCKTNMPTNEMYDNNGSEGGSKGSPSVSLRLARYRYTGNRGINGEGDEDEISLGESAKMTQAKLRHMQERHEHDEDGSDYTASDEHEHERNGQHEQGSQHDTQNTHSDAGTKHTDVSTAQSNIAEQAEITERRELEEMKSKVQGDTTTEEVLRFILEKLTMLQIGFKELKAEQSNVTHKIALLEQAGNKSRRAINYTASELQEIATNNFKLIQATIKQDQDISALQNQMRSCETKIQKGSLTITGIQKTEDEDLQDKVQTFFSDKLKLTKRVWVKTVYRMSKYKIALQLNDPNDVGLIFKNVKHLKGVKNENEKYYHVDEFLPDHQYEQKIRKKDIMRENQRMPFTYQAEITKEKNKLHVTEGENKREIKNTLKPDPIKNFLLMSKNEEDMLEALQLIGGPEKSENGSRFISYVATVGSLDMVKLMYRRLKNEHQMATHCIGAYRIFGKEHYDLQSYCDDGEHGGGRRILNVLKELNVYNIAVFIVRYKDGDNIGKMRFEIISELAKLVVARKPSLDRGERRNPEEREVAEALAKAVTWKKGGEEKRNHRTE